MDSSRRPRGRRTRSLRDRGHRSRVAAEWCCRRLAGAGSGARPTSRGPRCSTTDNARLDTSGRDRTCGVAVAVGGRPSAGWPWAAAVWAWWGCLSSCSSTFSAGAAGMARRRFSTSSGRAASRPPRTTREIQQNCQTGQDANNKLECAVVADIDSIQAYWTAELPRLGAAYVPVPTVWFSGQVSTGLRRGQSGSGPFYCPADKTVYIDLTFYDDLKTQFGAQGGLFVDAYVLAHEYGHHVQDLLGIEAQGPAPAQTGPTSDSVRLELQADCYAGVWAKHATEPGANGSRPSSQHHARTTSTAALDAAAGSATTTSRRTSATDSQPEHVHPRLVGASGRSGSAPATRPATRTLATRSAPPTSADASIGRARQQPPAGREDVVGPAWLIGGDGCFDARGGFAGSGPARPGPARPGDAKLGDARRPGDAGPGHARPGYAGRRHRRRASDDPRAAGPGGTSTGGRTAQRTTAAVLVALARHARQPGRHVHRAVRRPLPDRVTPTRSVIPPWWRSVGASAPFPSSSAACSPIASAAGRRSPGAWSPPPPCIRPLAWPVGWAIDRRSSFLSRRLADIYRPGRNALSSPIWSRRADRARAFALLFWAINLGFSVASVAAGVLLHHVGFGAAVLPDAARTLAFGTNCAYVSGRAIEPDR